MKHEGKAFGYVSTSFYFLFTKAKSFFVVRTRVALVPMMRSLSLWSSR